MVSPFYLRAAILCMALATACGRAAPPAATTTDPSSPAGKSATEAAIAKAREVLDQYRHAAGIDTAPPLRSFRAVGSSRSSARPGTRILTLVGQYPDRFRRDERPGRGQSGLETVILLDRTRGYFGGTARLGGDGLSPDPAVRARAESRAARQAFVNFMAGVMPTWLADAGAVTFVHRGTVDAGVDRGAIRLALEDKDGHAGELLMDPDTHLPRRLTVDYQQNIRTTGGTYTVTYSDFQMADGLQLPHTIVQSSEASATLTWKIGQYLLNTRIRPADFAKPK